MTLRTLHRPSVVLHPGPTTTWHDATCAEDDLLVARLRCCVRCGARGVALDQLHVYLGVQRLTIAVTRCLRWAEHDSAQRELFAFLEARYAQEVTHATESG